LLTLLFTQLWPTCGRAPAYRTLCTEAAPDGTAPSNHHKQKNERDNVVDKRWGRAVARGGELLQGGIRQPLSLAVSLREPSARPLCFFRRKQCRW
jgi:hypothetical protein